MTDTPRKWIERAETVSVFLPGMTPLADMTDEQIAEIAARLNVSAYAALAAALEDEDEQEVA